MDIGNTVSSKTKSKMLDDKIGYVRVSTFGNDTSEDFKSALEQFKKDGAQGLIIDMRNNPGGILNEAISVSDLFLAEGDIVSIKGRKKSIQRNFTAKRSSKDILTTPIVVLINSGSASASEIVAGALSDNKRALIIGETSFGKGSVQNLIPLSGGTGVKLTIALYYTPSGKSIQAEGIEPNIDVAYSPDDKEKPLNPIIVRERDLNKHLEHETETLTIEQVKKYPAPILTPLPRNLSKDNRELLEKDNQLRTALQLLKNMPSLK